jgi:heparosan-N-sulfate-glucuronate 5-epimerase
MHKSKANIRLLLCLVFLTAVIYFALSNNIKTAKADISTFGYYFNSTTNSTAKPTATAKALSGSIHVYVNKRQISSIIPSLQHVVKAPRAKLTVAAAAPRFHLTVTASRTNSTVQITTDRTGVPIVGYGYQNGIYIGNQRNALTTAHFALGYYDRYIRNGSAVYKQLFLNNSNWLVNHAVNHGNYSMFEYNFPWPNYNLLPHWHSALAQSQGIEALIAANKLTGDKKYLDTAKQLLNSFYITVNNGGVTHKMGPSGWWFESFAGPGGRQPRFLTDMISTVLGIHDFYNHTGSREAKYLFDQGVLALRTSLPIYNVAGHNYSYSDIFRHINTPDNHELNVALLNQLYDITKDQTFKRYHDLWYNSLPKAR